MMMRMLDAAGLEIVTDGERVADVDNPKGYYELERVKDLETETDKSYVQDARGKVLKVISFLLKDLPDDNRYKVIFMRRHLDEVLRVRVQSRSGLVHEQQSCLAQQRARHTNQLALTHTQGQHLGAGLESIW